MIEIKLRQALLRTAEIIAHTKMHPAPLSKDQAAEFRTLVDAGRVEIENDQIEFTTPELLATWIPRYCASSIAEVWEDLDQTAQELRRTYYLFRTLGLLRSDGTTQLFLSLENDCGKNVLAWLEEAVRSGIGAQEANIPLNWIYSGFCKALPGLDYKPDDFTDQLGSMLGTTESNLLRRELSEAIERLAKQSQEKAEALLDAFLQRPEQRTAEFAANALKALWNFDPTKAHRQAIKLTEAKISRLQCIGAITLAWFRYELPSHEKELTATIDRLEKLCKSDDTNLLPTIAKAFGYLLAALHDGNQLQRIQRGVLCLASRKEPHVQYAVAQVLEQQANDPGESDLFWDALGHLSGVPACHKGVLKTLDWTMYRMVECNPKRVARYLEKVVISRLYGTEGDNDRLPNLYEHTVSHLIEEQQSVLESAITRWFASKDPRLHAAAAELVGHFIQESRQQPDCTIRLDSSELNVLDEEDVQRVICALTGYVEDFKALASLLISMLSRETISVCVRELIVNALEQVGLYNMPGVAGMYLRGLTEDADIPEPVRQVVTDALARSDDYYTSLKGRPNLKELMPPDNRVHRYCAESQKQMFHLYQETVFDGSGLLGLIPKTPVKYGRASFSSEDGNMASPVPMRTFRTDIEVPREPIIDPLGYKINRRKWQSMAVDGPPIESLNSPADNCDEASNEKEVKKA